MSYLRKVERQRPAHRAQATRDRRRRLAAQAAAYHYNEHYAASSPQPLPDGERSALRRVWDAMTQHRSRRSLAEEKRLQEKREGEISK